MSDETRALILDADGVFLSERPYWNAALGTACVVHGLVDAVDGRWDALADFAFGPVGLQRVTKQFGCNSNWDLAAALVRGLESRSWRSAVEDLLAAPEAEQEAAQTIGAAALRLHDPRHNGGDPLLGFGIDRTERFYAEVILEFQRVLNGEASIDWSFERWQLKEPLETTTSVFTLLRGAGHDLRVCTGRHREEIEAPIRTLKLEPWLEFSKITSADEVDLAEQRTGAASLGKPHWFAPACAAAGLERAIAALEGDTGPAGAGVYVGDALADFRAVESCRRRGLGLRYVHVRSGATVREQEQEIRESPGTIGVVSSLAEIPSLLEDATT